MTRQPHDQFAKQYLAELLASLGTIEISCEVEDRWKLATDKISQLYLKQSHRI